MPYRPEWPESARVLIEVLRAALHPMALRIEHIGSTAVPGMAAKDILDIQVSVADLKDVDETFDPPLFALGFERTGSITCPPEVRTSRPGGRNGSGRGEATWTVR